MQRGKKSGRKSEEIVRTRKGDAKSSDLTSRFVDLYVVSEETAGKASGRIGGKAMKWTMLRHSPAFLITDTVLLSCSVLHTTGFCTIT